MKIEYGHGHRNKITADYYDLFFSFDNKDNLEKLSKENKTEMLEAIKEYILKIDNNDIFVIVGEPHFIVGYNFVKDRYEIAASLRFIDMSCVQYGDKMIIDSRG